MLIGFLRSLQFIPVLESNTLQMFNQYISFDFSTITCALIFPSLICIEPPTDIIIENGLGWCVWCPDPNQFFSHDFFTFFFLPFPSFFVYHVIIEMAKLMIVIHKFKYWLVIAMYGKMAFIGKMLKLKLLLK